MKLSVIIPTHNRAEILRKCIWHIGMQRGIRALEIIVVDDGSTDHTAEVVAEYEGVQYIYQESSHQGVARNRGAEAATGDILVFIGDDIFMQPGFLATHLKRHQQHEEENVVVLGKTTWDPALEINPYMKFLESSGWQFGYDQLKPGFLERDDEWKFFYTSNISMKREYFMLEKFNEDFREYGWEDIELGYRLFNNHEMVMYYEPAAFAYHHHPMNEADLPLRMRKVGASAIKFERLQPDVDVVPKGMKKMVIKLATNPLAMKVAGKTLAQPTYYKMKCWKEFMHGMKQ